MTYLTKFQAHMEANNVFQWFNTLVHSGEPNHDLIEIIDHKITRASVHAENMSKTHSSILDSRTSPPEAPPLRMVPIAIQTLTAPSYYSFRSPRGAAFNPHHYRHHHRCCHRLHHQIATIHLQHPQRIPQAPTTIHPGSC